MQNKQPPKWLANEVTSGLQRLYSLSLPFSPPAETIKLTGAAWIDAFYYYPCNWEQDVDQVRIRQAFQLSTAVIERWPAPRNILDLLPPRPVLKQIQSPKISKAQWQRNIAKLRNIIKTAKIRNYA